MLNLTVQTYLILYDIDIFYPHRERRLNQYIVTPENKDFLYECVMITIMEKTRKEIELQVK